MCSIVHKIAVLFMVVLCDGTSVNYKYDDIEAKTKVQLKPIEITCSPNEIILLTTPVVNCKNSKYHLLKPNGDILRTKISTPNTNVKFRNIPIHGVVIKYINEQIKAIFPPLMYKIINLATEDENVGYLDFVEGSMNENDFMVGPLLEEDHGNWVLSIYCQDDDAEWLEMYQVITVTIITYVDMAESKVELAEGSTFNLSFLYPIKGLETCELTAPRSVSDRFFDRHRIDLDKCGYIVRDIRRSDEGRWKVIGVGRMVYEGRVELKVIEDRTQRRKKKIGKY